MLRNIKQKATISIFLSSSKNNENGVAFKKCNFTSEGPKALTQPAIAVPSTSEELLEHEMWMGKRMP